MTRSLARPLQSWWLIPARAATDAARLFPASWGTIGGALTDLQFHVLDANDVVIPNVFAVGECATSMLFGDYYFGGYSLGFYTAAGKIAAETAVAEINAK